MAAVSEGTSRPLHPSSFVWQRRLRVWHRRLAVITAVQLLLWTLSGAYFAFFDIEKVRGEPHRRALPIESIDLSQFDFPITKTSQLSVKPRLKDELVIGVVDSKTGATNWLTPQGAAVKPLTSEEVTTLVWQRTDIAANKTEWVTTASESAEYRGRQLPLWRAYDVDQPSISVYVDPRSGDIVAIRNTAWRVWDFLWMLHIMDYDDRDDIGTWLLKLFSLLALLTAIAGIVLYALIPRRVNSLG